MNATSVLVTLRVSGVPIVLGSQRNCIINEETAVIDGSSKNSRVLSSSPGRYGCTIVCEALHIPNDETHLALRDCIRNGDIVQIYATEVDIELGFINAICTELVYGLPDQAEGVFAATFVGVSQWYAQGSWYAGGKSLFFDNTSPAYLANATNLQKVNFGISNQFSVMAWVKPDDNNNGLRYIFELIANSGGEISVGVDFTWHWFTARIEEQTTGNKKSYWFGSWVTDVWTQLFVTWNGAANQLRVFDDGVEDTSPTKDFDDSITITNPWRYAAMGANVLSPGVTTAEYNGLIHQIALWNTTLTPAEVKAVYNEGDGNSFNLLTNRGDYVSSATLRHWYCPGLYPSPDLGIDFGNLPVDVSAAYNVDDGDITYDAPMG